MIFYRECIVLTPHPEKDVHPYLLLAQWTPLNGHGLVMVQDYDIYYRTSPMSIGYRVTNTAVPGILSNGVPDWLYEGKVHVCQIIRLLFYQVFVYAQFGDNK